MALDLSVKSLSNFVSPSHIKNYCREEESSSNSSDSCEEDAYNNNSTMTALNLSLPKLLEYDDDELEEEEDEQDGKCSDRQLSSQQLQLDIAALNLLCLARLQETAAVLAGRRPLPAHLSSSSSSSPSSDSLVSSSPLNRRTHRCDEPGCDKVIFLNRKTNELKLNRQYRKAALTLFYLRSSRGGVTWPNI